MKTSDTLYVDASTAFIANNYGYDSQSRQCIEEMAELTQAINKFWRHDLECGQKPMIKNPTFYKDTSEHYNNLVEEIADVKIMLMQLEHLLQCKYAVEEAMLKKLERQLNRMIKKESEEVI